MYISRIKLHNIRGFKDLDLIISDQKKKNEPRMRTIIIGKNGTCKTTLLRCIAIGLCDESDGNALISEEIGTLVSMGEKSAKITIELRSTTNNKFENITKIMVKNGKEIIKKEKHNIPLENLFVCGYGAGRGVEGPGAGRDYRILDSVYTLFRYDEILIDPELSLRRLKDFLGESIYESTMKGIKKVLNLSSEDKIKISKGGGVTVSGPKIRDAIPLKGLADGYRMSLNWILDLYAWAMKAKKVTQSGDIDGILLVDEIEQHLHPSMQMELILEVSKLMPHMQIFVTTHSPLVVLGASQNDLVALHRDGKFVTKEENPIFSGYSVEDMLVNDRLFGTEVNSPETNEMLKKYRKLIIIPKEKRTSSQIDELKSITKIINSFQPTDSQEDPVLNELNKLISKYDL